MRIEDRIGALKPYVNQAADRAREMYARGELSLAEKAGKKGIMVVTPVGEFFLALSESQLRTYGDEIFDQPVGYQAEAMESAQNIALSEGEYNYKVHTFGPHRFSVFAHDGIPKVGEISVYRSSDKEEPNNEWKVDRSNVRPAHQGKGVGRALYEKAIEHVRKQGGENLHSDVYVSNQAGKIWHRLKDLGHDVTIKNNGKHFDKKKEGFYSHDGGDMPVDFKDSGYILNIKKQAKLSESIETKDSFDDEMGSPLYSGGKTLDPEQAQAPMADYNAFDQTIGDHDASMSLSEVNVPEQEYSTELDHPDYGKVKYHTWFYKNSEGEPSGITYAFADGRRVGEIESKIRNGRGHVNYSELYSRSDRGHGLGYGMYAHAIHSMHKAGIKKCGSDYN